MIIEKARIALEKLRRTNYKQRPDFGLDATTEELISIMANECKSTVLDGNNTRKYESDIIRNNIDEIIRQLIINGSCIPKEVMNKIAYSSGRVVGVNRDIEIFKGITEAEDGSVKNVATIGNSIISISKLDPSVLSKINDKIYKSFGRQLVLGNLKEFPKQNALSVFKEKLLHGREDRAFLEREYIKILKENTNYNDDIIRSTVEYNLDYMYDEKFKKEIISTINGGNGLIPIDNEKNKKGLNNLFMAVQVEARRHDECITRYK